MAYTHHHHLSPGQVPEMLAALLGLGLLQACLAEHNLRLSLSNLLCQHTNILICQYCPFSTLEPKRLLTSALWQGSMFASRLLEKLGLEGTEFNFLCKHFASYMQNAS